MSETLSLTLWMIFGFILLLITTGPWTFVIYPAVIIGVIVARLMRDARSPPDADSHTQLSNSPHNPRS